MKTRALVLAAGKGKRMQSDRNKVLHRILGKTVIEFVIDFLAIEEIERTGIVVGEHNIEDIKLLFGDRVDYILQSEPKGTGHAVMCAEKWLIDFDGNLLVVVGDAPFLDKKTIRDLIQRFETGKYACVLLSAIFDSPPAYGRIVRNHNHDLVKIVEEKDATDQEKRITEVSSSHYCFSKSKLFTALKMISNTNEQNEYYLPDVIGVFIKNGESVEAIPVDDPMVTFGINSRKDLLHGIQKLRERISSFWLENGVTIIDPLTTYIDATVKIGKDSLIHPFSYIANGSKIGKNCEIGPYAYIERSTVSDNTRLAWTKMSNNQKG